MRLDEIFEGITSTPEFRQWFAGSKLVDSHGNPLRLYHGTSKDDDFKKFRLPGNGIWFSTNPKDASDYAINNDSQGHKLDGWKVVATNTAHRVIPVYVRAINPLVTNELPESLRMAGAYGGDPTAAYRKAQREWFTQLRQEGYDAVVIGGDTVVVIGSPNQIKSAIGNKTFNSRKPGITESASWYLVMVKDGIARVLPEDRFKEVWALEDQGWKLVWDSARDEATGYAYAEQYYDAWPADSHHPKRMTEPQVLYRSVSLLELDDILASGVITGKQNEFNPFDSRRYVFFGDQMSSRLISQGEEIERQAEIELRKNSIHQAFERLATKMKDLGQLAADKARKSRLQVEDVVLRYTEQGHVSSIRKLLGELRDWDGIDRLNQLTDAEQVMRDRYRKMLGSLMGEMARTLAREPFTSAVLQTKPITGGLHYSKAHGESGMGDEDEYGFRPGQVTLADVERIFLIKRGKVVGERSPEELRQELASKSPLEMRGGTEQR